MARDTRQLRRVWAFCSLRGKTSEVLKLIAKYFDLKKKVSNYEIFSSFNIQKAQRRIFFLFSWSVTNQSSSEW
jgi:hypothetical protein